MVDYDVLFAVVLRIDGDEREMERRMEKATKKLGNCISDVYSDCAVIPVGFEEVDDDKFLNILNSFEFIGEEE